MKHFKPMPQQFTRIAAPGSLLKRSALPRQSKRSQSGPITDDAHLICIRSLPCLACGAEGSTQAAHLRLNSGAFGKRQAMGQKPDDRWVTPLCDEHHREQHKIGEANFWQQLDLNPFLICEALHSVTGDIPRMRMIVLNFIAERGRE